MKRVASLVVAIASITIPGAAYAVSVAPTASVAPAGALPQEVCSPAAPVVGAVSGTPAAPVATTLCSK